MEFSIFKKFHEREQAEALGQMLNDNQIDFEISQHKESLDSLYGDKPFNQQFFVKVKQTDFSKANSVLSESVAKELETIDKGHYLYEFTDQELFDVLSKPDEWSELDFQLAQKILRERGKEINNTTIELLKKQRINELAKPEESPKAWIYAGYLFSLMGGLLGIFMGLALITAKKTLPNGQKTYAYSDDHRKHGKWILAIGLAMLLVSIAIRIATSDY
jgi:hypothetical protein